MSRRKLRIFGFILTYFVLAVGLAFFWHWKAACPQGKHVWEYLYQGNNFYQMLVEGGKLSCLDFSIGNGTEILRFMEPFVGIVLAVAQFILDGSSLSAYCFLIGLIYFLSAVSVYWIGERENRPVLGFLMGAAWFFTPVNWHLLFAEGEPAKSFIVALLPFFFWNIYCYTEKEKSSSTVYAAILYFLFLLCSVKYTTVIFLATACYLLVFGIARGKIKSAFNFFSVLILPYFFDGFWLCAFFKNYGTVSPTRTEKAAYYQKILQTLNPFSVISGEKEIWYLGIGFFVFLLLGLFFSYRETSSYFITGVVLLFMTTTVFSGAAMTLPGLKTVDMTLFFPVIVCLVGIGVLLWNTLRKSLLLVFVVFLYVEAGITVGKELPDFFQQPMQEEVNEKAETMLLEEAIELTNQRIAIFAEEEKSSMAAYFVAESGKEISVTQGLDDNISSIPNYMGQLEQALTDGKYSYLFDRCLELGDDTVLIEKSRLESQAEESKNVTDSAEKSGYVLKDENEAFLLYHMQTEGQFGVVSEYDAIGIGSSAGMLALEYPALKETSSTNLNDYTYEELSKYKCIYLNGFTYDDKEAAEEMLVKLSENGVRIIIEAGGIPADIISKNREFLGVTCNNISFEKGFPILYTGKDEYDCNLFAKNHEEWKTVYIIGLENEWGYFYENDSKIDFMGTVKNDNIVFIALNLGYHYALTGDPMVEEIYDGLFDLTDKLLPEREIVPVKMVYSKNHITIEADTAVNTTFAFHDNFYSEQKLKEDNQLLYVEAGTTVIEIKPAYAGAGGFIVFVGLVLAVPYYVYIFSRTKAKKVEQNERKE